MYLTRGSRTLIDTAKGVIMLTNCLLFEVSNQFKFFFVKKNSETDRLASLPEVRFAGFLAEYNLPFAAADHLKSLIRVSFPDSKSAQAYSMGKTKATCILNGAIPPDLQSTLVEKMKSAVYSLAIDGSNDQNLEKMNPLTVRYFDEPQHKVVAQFLDMCLSRSSAALEKHNIPWFNCIALGVDNISVNLGKHKSIIVAVRK